MPAARFIRLAARTAASESIVGAGVCRRAGKGPTADRKVSVRIAKPKSVATGVTMTVALRVIVCPCANVNWPVYFSRRRQPSARLVDAAPSPSWDSGHYKPIAVLRGCPVEASAFPTWPHAGQNLLRAVFQHAA